MVRDLDRGEAGYCTAMVMVLEGTPFCSRSRGAVGPASTPAGISTFTW